VRQNSSKRHWGVVRFIQKGSAGITLDASKGTQGNRGKRLASGEAIGRGLRMTNEFEKMAREGRLEDRYNSYLKNADNCLGQDITNNNEPLKTFDEWLSI